MPDEPDPTSLTNRSGGADLNAQGDIHIGGDVAGRDKVTHEEKIDTGGGANIGGNATVDSGAEFVGRDKIVYEAPRVGANLLHQLPSPPADFTGRTAELAELCAKFEQGVTISGLQGQGGVGKTALALCLAAQLMERYPDAQIFLDLKGVSSSPLTAGEIMAYVARSFDLAAKLPDDEAGLAAAYRTVLFNKQVLLLLDNARDAEQIKPLLPPPAGCGVIVTSRLHFHVPGLFAQNLEALPAQDARTLLLKIEARIGGEADHIARLCGYLPLTLTMAGSALAERIDLSPASYARRLEDVQTRLDMVAASYTLSYELLNTDLQATWSQLSVFPDTFDAQAAAAVCDLDPDVAQDRLSELLRYSLVEWNTETARYRLHDLARLFSDSKLNEASRTVIQARHAMHYRNVLSVAHNLYLKGGDALMAGLALFDQEWENIKASQAWAAWHVQTDDRAVQLCRDYSDTGQYYLSLRLHPREQIRWLNAALSAARQLNDRDGEGAALGNLGLAYAALGDASYAIDFYEQALVIARELSTTADTEEKRIAARRNEGAALGNLGLASIALGEPRRAVGFFEQHSAIAREIGDHHSNAMALGNLGVAYAALGELRHATEVYEQALMLTREIGERHDERYLLNNLGKAYRDLSKPRHAIELFEQALMIARDMGDRHVEEAALANLGLAYMDLGEPGRAIDFYKQAFTIAHEIGDRGGEGVGLDNLGTAYAALGDLPRANDLFEQRLVIAHETGDRRGEAYGLNNLGGSHMSSGDTRRAIDFCKQALIIAREIGDRFLVGKVLSSLGNVYMVSGDLQNAIEFYELALETVREIGDKRGVGNALGNLGLAYMKLGERGRAIDNLEKALQIFEEIEDPHAEKARKQLASWRAVSNKKNKSKIKSAKSGKKQSQKKKRNASNAKQGRKKRPPVRRQ